MISIVIATSGRVEKIRRLLESLRAVEGRQRIAHEIVIANNAPDEKLAAEVANLAAEFDDENGPRCRHVAEPVPGKCRAQNRAIRAVNGELVAFLDDDVEVVPQWLAAIDSYFNDLPHDVMQGSILMRSQDRANEALQRALQRFRTVDFLDYGYPRGRHLTTLTGGNMVVRREVFAAVGLFNESLGPGGLGISEDVEFAKRVVRAGKRIGWEPQAGVYNELDPERLCEDEFRRRHEAQGRSRLAYKQQSLLRILPNCLRSMATFAWYSVLGNERKKYRAKGRYFHYRAMLVEKTKKSREANFVR